MVAEVISSPGFAGRTGVDLDRLVLNIRDIPSTCPAVRRIVESLRDVRRHAIDGEWDYVAQTLRANDIGRLLRTDPMVRRCQWRQPGTDAYDIVEAFVMSWDDTADTLIEAEQPGPTINAVIVAMGLGAAIRERRTMIHGFLAAAGGNASVLGLGAGRAPEADLIAPRGPLPIRRWVAVDPASGDDAVVRKGAATGVEWRALPLLDYLHAAAGSEAFDLIYAVDALDRLGDSDAQKLIDKAVALLRPNGRLIVSAFAPDMAEAAYCDAVLEWRPNLRDELALAHLFGGAAISGNFARSFWRGGSDRVVFGSVEKQSWAA